MTNAQMQLFKRALIDAERAEIASYGDPSKVVFSESFMERFNKLLADMPKKRSSLKKGLVIAIAAALIIAMMMSVSAVREFVLRPFVMIYEEYFAVMFEAKENVHERIEDIFCVEYMPIEYIIIDTLETDSICKKVWDSRDSIISITQSIGKKSEHKIDSNYDSKTLLSIRGIEITCMSRENKRAFYWVEDGYFFMVICINVPEDEAIKVIEGIRIGDGVTGETIQ